MRRKMESDSGGVALSVTGMPGMRHGRLEELQTIKAAKKKAAPLLRRQRRQILWASEAH